ncbi:hypothetical protein ADK67_41380 [Saccharothrix sp. NRRL B-16348]|nr:hypothetical protein ADK67_41380 [Saccharothrix sp. NRRL B-16348]
MAVIGFIPLGKGAKLAANAVEAGVDAARTVARTPAGTITQKSLDHSFDRHAAQWFGGTPGKARIGEWQALIERASQSGKVIPWNTGKTLTNAHLARIDGKWFAVQYERGSGKFVTAHVLNQGQVGAMLKLLGK